MTSLYVTTYVTTAQAAKRLGVSRRRVRQFIKDGRLDAEKPGRDWLISRRSLDSFVKVQRKVGRPGTPTLAQVREAIDIEPDSFPPIPAPSDVFVCPKGHRMCRDPKCWK